jgi:hypothetical protein
MAVLFGVDLNNPEDNEAVASMPKAVPFVVDLLLFEVEVEGGGMGTELIFVVTLVFCCDGSGIIGWISIQSYPLNLDACGAAVRRVSSDNKLADACGRASVRCGAAVRRVKNGPQLVSCVSGGG